jgi:hypothetical protein
MHLGSRSISRQWQLEVQPYAETRESNWNNIHDIEEQKMPRVLC